MDNGTTATLERQNNQSIPTEPPTALFLTPRRSWTTQKTQSERSLSNLCSKGCNKAVRARGLRLECGTQRKTSRRAVLQASPTPLHCLASHHTVHPSTLPSHKQTQRMHGVETAAEGAVNTRARFTRETGRERGP